MTRGWRRVEHRTQREGMTDMAAAATKQSTDPFGTDLKISWYRSPIDRALLTKLMQRNNGRGALQTAAHLGLFFVTAYLAYLAFLNVNSANWYGSVPLLLLALFAHGTIGPFMGLIAIHELQHRTVFESKAMNAFFEKVYAFISWSDYVWYESSHVKHHQVTCHRAYDGEVQLPQKFSLRRWSFWLGLLAWNPSATWAKLKLVWNHANGRIEGAWYRHVLPESDSALRRRHRNWARTLLIGHGLLAALFILTGHWFLIVVFTFGTFYCGWLGFLCGLPQHFGLNSRVRSPVRGCPRSTTGTCSTTSSTICSPRCLSTICQSCARQSSTTCRARPMVLLRHGASCSRFAEGPESILPIVLFPRCRSHDQVVGQQTERRTAGAHESFAAVVR
ncbi:MAG: fatty acid desaturase [Proteobacteria bacterium]|nr:fatty acid desaturase [Pseudomonadota bacterium]